MYMWRYRDEGAFHEAVTNRILDDLVKVTSPRTMTVEAEWFVRGGITTFVNVTYAKKAKRGAGAKRR